MQRIHWPQFIRRGFLALMVGFALLGNMVIGPVGTAQAAPTPATGMARTSDNGGYWLVTQDGAIYGYGNARYHGGANGIPHAPIVDMAARSDNGGYWLVASDGAVYGYGAASYYGGANGIPHAPIVGMAARSDNGGYWLVADDGAVYSYGAASYYGGANGGTTQGNAIQPVSGRITGVWTDRCPNYDSDHYGIDIAAPAGTPIVATASGTVTVGSDRDKWDNLIGRGHYVIVRHNNGYTSHYFHLSRFAAGLASGQVKAQGALIGYVGTTGNSTGNHLHFGMQKNGAWMNLSSAYGCGQTITQGQPIRFSFSGI